MYFMVSFSKDQGHHQFQNYITIEILYQGQLDVKWAAYNSKYVGKYKEVYYDRESRV